MTLERALKAIKPLSYMAEVGDKPGADIYCIQTFKKPKPSKPIASPSGKNFKPWPRAGRSKEVHLTTTCTPQFLRHVLSVAYKELLEGSRVEFHLRPNHKSKGGNGGRRPLAEMMHLRPDAIFAAMPEGTTMLAQPAIDTVAPKNTKMAREEEEVMWAMEHAETLGSVGEKTDEAIKQLGQWDEHGLILQEMLLVAQEKKAVAQEEKAVAQEKMAFVNQDAASQGQHYRQTPEPLGRPERNQRLRYYAALRGGLSNPD